MKTVEFSFSINEELKQKAFSVFAEYGMSPVQAMKIFLTQVANTHQIPLDLNYNAEIPNAATVQAMQEAIENRKNSQLKAYSSNQEMYEDLKREFANDSASK